MSVEQITKLQELLKLLAYFGITEEILKELPRVVEAYKDLQVSKTMTKQDKMDLEEKMKKVSTPEELVQMFAQETEEFYPDGNRPKTNHAKS